MKELNIEQKAKRYDEVIKKVNDYYEGKTKLYSDVDKTLDYLFPALKENEDEKIRKELIAMVKLSCTNGNDADKKIAWIEKQGKHDMGISEATKKELEDKLHKALEKETSESLSEFLDEQKPADKAEPKFKVGDWIVFNDNLYHVVNITLQRYYECLRVDGTVHTFGLDIDSKSHLWSIQDAKDGDVLVYNNGCVEIILLFKKWFDGVGKGAYSYAHIVSSGRHIHINDWSDCGLFAHPATKEQRDILFQKMHEAGYEWDAEHKQLKKIEQKPADTEKGAKGNEREIPNSAWGEDDETKLKSACALIRNTSLNGNEGIVDSTIAFLKSLKERVQSQSQWKPSEEQIEALVSAIDVMIDNRGAGDKNTILLSGLYHELKTLW